MEKQREKCKNRGGASVFILIILLVVVAGAVTAYVLIQRNKKYTTGEVDGKTYTNRWADVRIELTDEYAVYDYSNSMPKGFDAPFVFVNVSNQSLGAVMMREGKPDLSRVEEEMREAFGGGSGVMSVQSGKSTVQMTFTSERRMFGGYEYICLKMAIPSYTIYCAFRSCHDNGVICIVAAGKNEQETDKILKMLQKY